VAPRPRENRFPADPGSIAAARQFAAEAVTPVHPELSDAVTLMVSELATNAIRHGRTEYVVSVKLLPTGVRVEVSDLGKGWPKAARVTAANTGGRGLRIVEAIAGAWGVVPGSPPPGKTVWFEVRAGTEN
jgi:anti-sigma regulatory factor (Ser/Thr protein kinase)